MIKFALNRVKGIIPFVLGALVAVPINTAVNVFGFGNTLAYALTKAGLVFLFTTMAALILIVVVEFFYFSYLSLKYKVPLAVIYYSVDNLDASGSRLPYILEHMGEQLIAAYKTRNALLKGEKIYKNSRNFD